MIVRKDNPLSQLCSWASLCCRVWRNGDISIAFFSPLTADFSTWSSNLGLSCACWVCLFFLWIVAAQDVRRKSRAPGDRPDVWYGKFFCVLEQKKLKFFSTNTHSWVQGRKELVRHFHRHSREEWSSQVAAPEEGFCWPTPNWAHGPLALQQGRSPGSKTTLVFADLLLYLNCIWSLSARSFYALFQTSIFFPLHAFWGVAVRCFSRASLLTV